MIKLNGKMIKLNGKMINWDRIKDSCPYSYGGVYMVSWVWIPVALVIGCFFGFLLTALIIANDEDKK